MAKKILIIQTAFIGDAILGSAMIPEIKRLYPEALVDYLVRDGNQGLFQDHPQINRVWVWQKKKHKWKNLFLLAQSLREQNYDLCLNLHRHLTSGLFSWFSRAKTIVGFKENPLSLLFHYRLKHQIPHLENHRALHEVERNAELLRLLQPEYQRPPAQQLKPLLAVQKKNDDKVFKYQDVPYVVVAPASVWFTKQWPWENFKELVKMISQEMKVYLIGGPDDFSLAEKVRDQQNNVENLCGQLNLLDSAALMKKAHRVIVNDSGPLHLASAMNAPTVGIFCSTIKEFGYFPLSDKSWVLETKEKLSCRPCGLHGKTACPLSHFQCAMTITPQDVFKTIIP